MGYVCVITVLYMCTYTITIFIYVYNSENVIYYMPPVWPEDPNLVSNTQYFWLIFSCIEDIGIGELLSGFQIIWLYFCVSKTITVSMLFFNWTSMVWDSQTYLKSNERENKINSNFTWNFTEKKTFWWYFFLKDFYKYFMIGEWC